MSSTNLPASSVGGDRRAKKTRDLSLPHDVWEKIVVQYLLPECTWDSVEECVGWCREVIVDPAPLKRIGREWMKRAKGMRTLLEALYVRTVDPRDFCRGTIGIPHPIAILLGEVVERDQEWQMEVLSQDPSIVHKNFLMEFPLWWMYMNKNVIKRTMEGTSPIWCSLANPGVKEEYFQLWRHLNMLYKRLSLPWKWLVCASPSWLGFEPLKPIRAAINSVYHDIESRWEVRRGDIQNYDSLPLEEQIRAYEEDQLEPRLGRRTPWMKLDYDSRDTETEEMRWAVPMWYPQPRDKRPRKLYRQHCTWRELSILDRECSVDGIPWAKD